MDGRRVLVLLGLMLATPAPVAASTCAQTTRVILVRHAQTEWNVSGLLQGNADVPLDERGRAQARALADALAGTAVDTVYSSPLARARETARAIAAARGLTITTSHDLREIGVGKYTGSLPSQIPSETRRAWNSDPDFAMPSGMPDPAALRDPGHVEGRWFEGESLHMVAERGWKAIRSIAAQHCGGTVVVVTHGGVIQTAVTAAKGLPLTEFRKVSVPNAGRMILEFHPDDSVRVSPGP